MLLRCHSNKIRRFDEAPSQRTTRGVAFTWKITIVWTNQWGSDAVCCPESWGEEQKDLETRWEVLEDARRELLRSGRINLRNGAKGVCRNRKSLQLPSTNMRRAYIGLNCVILRMVMPQIHSLRMNGKCGYWWHDKGLRAAWLPVKWPI